MIRKIVFGVALPVVVIGLGVVAARAIASFAPEPAKSQVQERRTLVEVRRLSATTEPARIPANGIVVPERQVVVSPQVSGRVVWRSRDLEPGGRVRAGAQLVRIDRRDYELAIRAEQSRVRKAELDLQVELGRQGIAQREWDLLRKDSSGDPASALTLRKPHLEAVRVALEAAKGGLERAQLNLERTVIRAPFNAMVRDVHADKGQIVQPGTRLATLVGTDRFWVRAAVPVDRLAMMNVPGVNAKAEEGSRVVVRQRLDGAKPKDRAGAVVRLEGDLDVSTRRAQILVAVESPLVISDGGVPLLPGAYVDLEIHGRPLDGVFVIPRSATYGGDHVWVASEQDELRRRSTETVWGDAENLYVIGELVEGDRLVTSRLSLPIEGAPIRVKDAGTRS